ncbi:MAG: tetratricopeptide repeat protein [Pyrinomonadaceae bacterium]
MSHKKTLRVSKKFWSASALVLFLSLAIFQTQTFAQTESPQQLKQKALEMMQSNNVVEAIPLLEKALAASPNDGELNFYLGFALIGRTKTLKTDEEKLKDFARAKQYFEKAKQLSYRNAVLDQLLAAFANGGDSQADVKFSANKQADDEMQAGEAAYVQGKLDEAIAHYKKAFELDAKIYEAPLFIGDMYYKKDDYPQAEIWFQKAIAVDKNRETAYRYSASPLMKQEKYDLARDRYIEAFISEPFNRLARGGFIQWGQITNTVLAHPDIKIPDDITKITDGKTDDGSFAWAAYAANRALWQNGKDGKLSDKFRAAYPNETQYRHSLAEEAESLKAAAELVKKRSSEIKTLDPSLKTLVELSDKGLLEAYILLARPDEGIVEDYIEYRDKHRDNLRRYVSEYVAGKSGK